MPATLQPVLPKFQTRPDMESGSESGLNDESGEDYSGNNEEGEGWSDSSTGKLSTHPSLRGSSTKSGSESGSQSGHVAGGEKTSGSEEEWDNPPSSASRPASSSLTLWWHR